MNWNAPKQKHLVENGELGDCWSCCIAAILNLPREEVPFFLKDSKAEGSPSMHVLTQQWLNQRGLILIELEKDVHVFPRMWKDPHFPEDLVWIACGPTPRSKALGQHHAIVTNLTDDPVFKDFRMYDPHPSDAGLTYVAKHFLIMRLL